MEGDLLALPHNASCQVANPEACWKTSLRRQFLTQTQGTSPSFTRAAAVVNPGGTRSWTGNSTKGLTRETTYIEPFGDLSTIKLLGWSRMEKDMGIMRDVAGISSAVVQGLNPNKQYKWSIKQTPNTNEVNNKLTVNHGSQMTLTQSDRRRRRRRRYLSPSSWSQEGTVASTPRGEIIMEFEAIDYPLNSFVEKSGASRRRDGVASSSCRRRYTITHCSCIADSGVCTGSKVSGSTCYAYGTTDVHGTTGKSASVRSQSQCMSMTFMKSYQVITSGGPSFSFLESGVNGTVAEADVADEDDREVSLDAVGTAREEDEHDDIEDEVDVADEDHEGLDDEHLGELDEHSEAESSDADMAEEDEVDQELRNHSDGQLALLEEDSSDSGEVFSRRRRRRRRRRTRRRRTRRRRSRRRRSRRRRTLPSSVSASCPSGHRVLSCTCYPDSFTEKDHTWTITHHCKEVWLSGEKCYAKGGYAQAICAEIPEPAARSWGTVTKSGSYASNQDSGPTAQCSSDKVMTGCWCKSTSGAGDGCARVWVDSASNKCYGRSYVMCVSVTEEAGLSVAKRRLCRSLLLVRSQAPSWRMAEAIDVSRRAVASRLSRTLTTWQSELTREKKHVYCLPGFAFFLAARADCLFFLGDFFSDLGVLGKNGLPSMDLWQQGCASHCLPYQALPEPLAHVLPQPNVKSMGLVWMSVSLTALSNLSLHCCIFVMRLTRHALRPDLDILDDGLTPKALLGGFMDATGGALNKQVRVLHVQMEESSYFQRYEKVDGAILLIASRTWKCDPVLDTLVKKVVMNKGSIVQLIHHSDVVRVKYAQEVRAMQHNPMWKQNSSKFSAAKHRWATPFAKLCLTMEAVLSIAQSLHDERKQERVGAAAKEFLMLATEENLVLLGMLADAGEENLQLVRFLDSETTGFTQHVLQLLSTQRVLYVDRQPRRLGGAPQHQMAQTVASCLQRFKAWTALAKDVVSAEFPCVEALQTFSIFHLRPLAEQQRFMTAGEERADIATKVHELAVLLGVPEWFTKHPVMKQGSQATVKRNFTGGGASWLRGVTCVEPKPIHAGPRFRAVPRCSALFRADPRCSALIRAVPRSSALFRALPRSSALFRALPRSSALFRALPRSSALFRPLPRCSALFRAVPFRTLPRSSALFRAVLRSSALFPAVPRCSALFRAVPRCSALFRALPRSSALFRALPRCSALFRALPRSSVLFRALPRSPALSRALPRSPALSRALPRSAALFRIPRSSALFRALPRSSALFRTVPRCSALFRAVPRCSALFRAVPRCSALLRAVPRCSALFRANSAEQRGTARNSAEQRGTARNSAEQRGTARKSAEERGRAQKSAEERGRARESAGERGRARKSAEERGRARKSAEERGTARNSAKQRGTARNSAEQRGTARNSAEQRGTARKSAEERGRARKSAEEGGTARNSVEQRGTVRSSAEQRGAARSSAEQRGTARNSAEQRAEQNSADQRRSAGITPDQRGSISAEARISAEQRRQIDRRAFAGDATARQSCRSSP
ncbi:unnamed protein product [Effrenium voratum]|uniref:Uncharacterized protein n=1 Tax=Effrenium voratum TaxID=2562239 RepID=A0AA36N9J6_9DINO|nr:unnamed protein product [Effrenium voratum]